MSESASILASAGDSVSVDAAASESGNGSDLRVRNARKAPSLFSAYINITTAIVGVGVLSYPYAFRLAGVLGGSLITAFFALMNAYTVHLVALATERVHTKLHARTFEEVVLLVFGTQSYYVAMVLLLYSIVGSLTGFIIVAADVGLPVFAKLLPGLEDSGELALRAVYILAVTLVILFPLCMLPNMHALFASSILAVASVLVVIGIVVVTQVFFVLGIVALAKHDAASLSTAKILAGDANFFEAIPLCIFALGCQNLVVPVYAELAVPERGRFVSVVASSSVTCAAAYVLMGICGYLHYGNGVHDNILLNFVLGNTVGDVARVAMAIHILLAYPVSVIPARRSLVLLYSKLHAAYTMRFQKRTGYFPEGTLPSMPSDIDSDARKAPSSNESPPDASGSDSLPPLALGWSLLQTFILVGTTALLAIVVPRIHIVLGLMGSTVGVLINFICPILLMQRLGSWERGRLRAPSSPVPASLRRSESQEPRRRLTRDRSRRSISPSACRVLDLSAIPSKRWIAGRVVLDVSVMAVAVAVGVVGTIQTIRSAF